MSGGVTRVIGGPKGIAVKWSWFIEPEHIDYHGEFGSKENEEWIEQELEGGNEAAWAAATVVFEIFDEKDEDEEELKGYDHLGGCSYESEDDLWHGLLQEMKRNAFDDLINSIQKGSNSRRQVVADFLLEHEDEIFAPTKWEQRNAKR